MAIRGADEYSSRHRILRRTLGAKTGEFVNRKCPPGCNEREAVISTHGPSKKAWVPASVRGLGVVCWNDAHYEVGPRHSDPGRRRDHERIFLVMNGRVSESARQLIESWDFEELAVVVA